MGTSPDNMTRVCFIQILIVGAHSGCAYTHTDRGNALFEWGWLWGGPACQVWPGDVRDEYRQRAADPPGGRWLKAAVSFQQPSVCTGSQRSSYIPLDLILNYWHVVSEPYICVYVLLFDYYRVAYLNERSVISVLQIYFKWSLSFLCLFQTTWRILTSFHKFVCW